MLEEAPLLYHEALYVFFSKGGRIVKFH